MIKTDREPVLIIENHMRLAFKDILILFYVNQWNFTGISWIVCYVNLKLLKNK